MKTINKNIFVFIIAFLIIGIGLLSRDYIGSGVESIKGFISNTKNEGPVNAFDKLTVSVDDWSTKYLSYHDQCMNFNSLYLNYTNQRVIKKDDEYVVKADNGHLVSPNKYIDDKTIDGYTDNIKQLYTAAKKNGTDFLYVVAPQKGYDYSFPANVRDYTNSNCDRYIKQLNDKNIPTLDLINEMKKDSISNDDMFFITDHHWTPKSGFWATGKVLEKLNSKYGFEYNNDYTNIDNFNIKTYDNWFLGSTGKKVGTSFSPLGIDDFDLITPKFKTDLIEEQPYKNESRKGSFENTVLFTDHIGTKASYTTDCYSTYGGGDFRLQIITNKVNKEGETILLVRDSFSDPVVPFLSLNASKVYVVDIRDYEYYVGERKNISEYITEIKPDKVIVLYSGVSTEPHDRYNFK